MARRPGWTRREWMERAVPGAAVVLLLPGWVSAQDAAKLVAIAEYTDAGKRVGVKNLPKVVKTEEQWRSELTRVSFEVTRHADTEVPFTGDSWNEHGKGLYRCICCDTAVFHSNSKYDSGTGWPSFWRPLDRRNVEEHVDRSEREVRMAISCRLCDAHLGHVFEDGPPPTGQRYCMNAAAMRFVKA